MMVITISTILTAVMSRLTSRKVTTSGFVNAFTTTSIRQQRRHHQSISSSFQTRSLLSSTPATTTTTANIAFSHRISSSKHNSKYQQYDQYQSNSIVRWMTSTGTEEVSTEERSDEEKEKIKAIREAKKAEKEQMKLEKKAKKEAEKLAEETANNLPIPDVMYMNINEQESYTPYGDMIRVMSRSETGRTFININEIESNPTLYPGTTKIWISGRLQSIRIKGGSCFLVIRQNAFHTIQCVYFKQSSNTEDSTITDQQQQMIKYLKSLTVESIIQLQGSIVTDANVKSCTVQTVELKIERIHTVSRADTNLPFQIEDAARSEDDIELSQSTDRPYPRLGQEIRLDNRWIDLRVPANNAILRIQSGVCQLFRESLYAQNFIEIHSPKLVAGESESGAGAFTTDYFGQTACLAQSPQLYKQMAISSDFNRVFEIGPVFRAEKSHTRRHLCEFTGLDIEMSINDHYIETLRVVHTMFKYIFNGLETRYQTELQVIREQYNSEPVLFTDEPCIIHWEEAMDILQNQLKFDIGDGLQDLTGAMELALGQVIKEKYNTDFFMLDKYPSNVRPFYTMPDPNNNQYSNSYDMFLRGQEICSGAQRCHDPILVSELIKEKNIVPGDTLLKYIESFQHGVSPHAGAGIGLERVVFLYLNLDNVRKASMFPRDPNRCVP